MIKRSHMRPSYRDHRGDPVRWLLAAVVYLILSVLMSRGLQSLERFLYPHPPEELQATS